MLSVLMEIPSAQGLIPADGEIWKSRRRALVPALHRKYLESMVQLFGNSSLHGIAQLEKAAAARQPVEMENLFSRLTLDIIGKAVFNYDFDSLTHDDPVIQVGREHFSSCAIIFSYVGRLKRRQRQAAFTARPSRY